MKKLVIDYLSKIVIILAIYKIIIKSNQSFLKTNFYIDILPYNHR